MGSNGKKKTTMQKLNRENKMREKRQEKEARKEARKRAAADGVEETDTIGTPLTIEPVPELTPSGELVR